MGNKAVVTSFKNTEKGHEMPYTLVGPDGSKRAESGLNLSIFDVVEESDGKITSVSDSENGRDEYSEYMKSIEPKLRIGASSPSSMKGDEAYSKLLGRMMPSINSAALRIARAYVTGAPMIVRYHNDGDGVSGAIALHRALSGLVARGLCDDRIVSWQMNRGVAYTMDSLYSDTAMFSAYSSAERPLLVITDFGSTGESTSPAAATSPAFDIVWIDHHVIPEDFKVGGNVLYINPFNFGGDSKLTAGLVSSVIAESIGAQCADLKEAALISDYSPYAGRGDAEGAKVSLILDYLTSVKPGREESVKSIDRTLQDRDKMESMFSSASQMLQEAIDAGMGSMKEHLSGSGIHISAVDFGVVARLGHEYPMPGRYASRLQDALEVRNGGKTITIVHYSSYISIRLSRDITAKVDILKLIAGLSASTDGALGGGGHREAASIKVGTYDMDRALTLLLDELMAV